MIKWLCVAEKPSIAKAITQILSGGQFQTVRPVTLPVLPSIHPPAVLTLIARSRTWHSAMRARPSTSRTTPSRIASDPAADTPTLPSRRSPAT